MPLIKQCSMSAFRQNIDIERGKRGEHQEPSDQGLAIAYSVLRKACGVPRDAPKMTPSKIVLHRKRKKQAQSQTNEEIKECLRSVMEVLEGKRELLQ